MRLRPLVLAAVLSLLAMGCGGSDAASRVRSTWDLVHQAGSATVVQTQLSEATIPPNPQFEGGTFETTVEADAAVDFDAERSRLVVTATFPEGIPGTPSGTHECRTIVDGSSLFVRVPEARADEFESPWLRFDEEGVPQLGASGSDPTFPLVFVYGAEEVEEVGPEEMGGVATTHYRVTVEKDKLVDEAPDEHRNALSGQLTNIETFPLEIWIDEDGLPRRMEATIEQVQAQARGTVQITVEFSDYGEVGEIELPEGDEVEEAGENVDSSTICLSEVPEELAEDAAATPAPEGEATPEATEDDSQSRFGEDE